MHVIPIWVLAYRRSIFFLMKLRLEVSYVLYLASGFFYAHVTEFYAYFIPLGSSIG
jgi:hypothetical protein